MHAPADVHVSAVTPQSWHFDPFKPQAPDVVGVTQVVPEQQPGPGHDAESQMQAPPLQICPKPHCAFVPQWHAPAAQLSADIELQPTHSAASVPHVEKDVALQVAPMQHPFGHDAALQTQLPPEQAWPAPQAAPIPHRHAPDAEQLSASAVSHPVQASPPTPHVTSVDESQLAPAQHPEGQFAAVQPVHTPPTQAWLVGHSSHDDPLVPHAAAVFPARHWPPAQQPVGHDVTLQVQLPFEQI